MTTMTPQQIDPETEKHVQEWLQPSFDAETRSAIQRMREQNPQELINSFYTKMTFGTGGLRGLVGIGCNRMNRYTVGFATQGLANYLKKSFKENSVFIGYDSRLHSREFAEMAARVLAGNGIKVYLSKELCSTPFTSFACRDLKCTAAIMVTASHNPKEYNGYKVYWADGGQVLPPHDTGIIKEAEKISSPEEMLTAPLDSPLIEELSYKVKRAYIDRIEKLQHFPKTNKESGKKLHIVYSNLHGTGITLIPEVLETWGFTHVTYVEAQKNPDGNFPTVDQPNPEDPSAMALGVKTLQEVNGDILIATDPDADRMRALINHNGSPYWLNGNQIACLLLYHICTSLDFMKGIPRKAAFIKTIVTTELFKKITEIGFGRPTIDVLTGFKYIAQKIHEWEQEPVGKEYIFGGEESYGTLMGTIARDKDAILATALFSEMALQQKLKGETVVDLLHTIYKKFGVYGEKLKSLNYPESKEGKDQMKQKMIDLRNNPPKTLAGIPIKSITDYNIPTTLPKSNVLHYTLENNSKVIVRPSGTEPKIKIYCEVPLPYKEPVEETKQQAENDCQKLIDDIQGLL